MLAACVERLGRQLDNPSMPFDDLASVCSSTLAAATKRLARDRGRESLPLFEALLGAVDIDLKLAALDALGAIPDERSARLLDAIVSGTADNKLRSAARRSLYRLNQAGIAPGPHAAGSRPFVARAEERLARAFSSGIDGAGNRGLWLVFENSHGGFTLLTLVVNDEAGILDCSGGPISKKQIGQELQGLRSSQKLPWIECPPERAVAAIREALAVHESMKTAPPESFIRWRHLLAEAETAKGDEVKSEALDHPSLVDHSAELLELPEMAGWFVNPESVQSEGVELLEARESRLVVNDQIKAEREAAIVDRVIERLFTEEACRRWAKRVRTMAWVFEETGKPRESEIAAATATSLADPEKSPRHIPFVRTLVERGLGLAGEVALGRVKREEVSRSPRKA